MLSFDTTYSVTEKASLNKLQINISFSIGSLAGWFDKGIEVDNTIMVKFIHPLKYTLTYTICLKK
jgi:hypothetical protein